MPIDAVVLSSITAAVTLLGQDYAKGLATEAGKTTWTNLKSLFGWNSDPAAEAIPERVAAGLVAAPELTEKVVELLKQTSIGSASPLVNRLSIRNGKVVIANSIDNLTM